MAAATVVGARRHCRSRLFNRGGNGSRRGARVGGRRRPAPRVSSRRLDSRVALWRRHSLGCWCRWGGGRQQRAAPRHLLTRRLTGDSFALQSLGPVRITGVGRFCPRWGKRNCRHIHAYCSCFFFQHCDHEVHPGPNALLSSVPRLNRGGRSRPPRPDMCVHLVSCPNTGRSVLLLGHWSTSRPCTVRAAPPDSTAPQHGALEPNRMMRAVDHCFLLLCGVTTHRRGPRVAVRSGEIPSGAGG